ncbi:sensor histidine kinase [Thiosulfativibrio zosterae]|uniref:histidine kinase n=1 Tax=Thiosulfativibrio zosterae TaxID=2675053 RepID=A0A6F8PLZ5_9GAMM|nr:ATP-binding protein [Thiosulfativibrio zosterae]BBP43129.1 PAS domain-containing sensor histidine kinase [Thiosulfativibrio zosterae]
MPNTLSAIEQSRLKELEQAFELFNQTSTQLTYAYESLQRQVVELQRRLNASDQEKRRVAERLEQLLNLLPAGVIVLDETDKIVEMNPSAEAILGADAKDRFWDVVVRNVFLSQNDAGELVTHEQLTYQLSVSPLSMAQPEHASPMMGKILLIQDVTPAKELQRHIARHQRLDSMGDMAASLAHQIRTPLASALLYVSQMNSETLDEAQREKFTTKALKSLQHLEALVKDMLQYAKGGRVHDQKVEVASLLELLKVAVEPSIQNTQSNIIFHPIQPGLVVLGDQDALLTALQNLVNNAMDIVSSCAHIEVSANVISKNRIDLLVVDRGPGLDESLLEKVFEPFYTSRAKGTGLGLAVVRAIAEAHQGEAWVRSIVGRGATFGLRLPLYEQKDKA